MGLKYILKIIKKYLNQEISEEKFKELASEEIGKYEDKLGII